MKTEDQNWNWIYNTHKNHFGQTISKGIKQIQNSFRAFGVEGKLAIQYNDIWNNVGMIVMRILPQKLTWILKAEEKNSNFIAGCQTKRKWKENGINMKRFRFECKW